MDVVKEIKSNKLLLYGLPIAVVAGLYFWYQNQKGGAAQVSPAGTTTSGAELSTLASQFRDAFKSIAQDNQTANKNLSDLITQSDADFVSSINAQTQGLGTAFSGLSSQLSALQSSAGTGDLEKAITAQTTSLAKAIADSAAGQNKAISDAIGGQSGAIATGFQQQNAGITSALISVSKGIIDAIQSAFASVGQQNAALETQLQSFVQNAFSSVVSSETELANVSKGIAKDAASNVQSLSSLTQNITAEQDRIYLQVGLQSAASCYVPDTGQFDSDCVHSGKLIDWTSGGGFQSTQAQIRAKYASCLRGDHFDLTCVGKLVSSRFGGN